MAQSRIVFVPGILTSGQLQEFQWGKAAREMFPGREVVVFQKTYVYLQHDTIEQLKQDVVDLLRDGMPTTLVGHSFGGIIVNAVYWQCKQDCAGNIVKLVTINSPHTLDAPGLEESRSALGYRYDLIGDIPVHTFSARFDHIVSKKYAGYPGSIHKLMWSTHSGPWLAPRSWRYRHIWSALRD